MKKIRNLFTDLLSKTKEINGKRIATIAAISLLLITPTVLAAVFVIHNELTAPNEYLSVTLYDSENKIIAEESQTFDNMGNSSLLKLFYHLISDDTHQITDAQNADGSCYVRAEIDHNGTKHNIKCYFSTEAEDGGYFIDDRNNRYAIPKKLNSDFLDTPYAEGFYSHSQVFTLTTADLDVITPQSTEWKYRTVSGRFLSAAKNQTTSEKKVYEITGAIDIAFDTPPDHASVQVFSNNTRIYTGSMDGLSSLEVNSNDVIRVCIDARWSSTNHREYFGSTKYEFYVHIKNRASFSISSDTVRAGGFIFLDCSNVNDIKKLSYSSSRNGFTPVFKSYNNRWRTVIPFSSDTTETAFNITFSYGATSESFSVKVLPSVPPADLITEKPIYTDSFNPDIIKKEIMKTKLSDNSQVYFRGAFEDPQNGNYTTVYTQGTNILYGDSVYSAIGNKYVLKDNTVDGGSVRAIQNGVVVYVGSSPVLGSFAVLDHGCGLRSWYTELGKVDVRVGDILLSGQHVGKTSQSVTNDTEGFTLFCTADNTVIDPEALWKKAEQTTVKTDKDN